MDLPSVSRSPNLVQIPLPIVLLIVYIDIIISISITFVLVQKGLIRRRQPQQ
jgi:hypothetical protein